MRYGREPVFVNTVWFCANANNWNKIKFTMNGKVNHSIYCLFMFTYRSFNVWFFFSISADPRRNWLFFLSFLLLQYRSFTTVLKEGLERSHLIVLPGTCLCATLTLPRLTLSVLTGSVTRNQGSGGNSFMCFDKRFYVRGECLESFGTVGIQGPSFTSPRKRDEL